MGGKLSAKRMCTLCHWASLAGVSEARPYSLRPSAQSGHFQRKLDAALGFREEDLKLYKLKAPVMVDERRESQVVHVKPPHEALADELQNHPAVKTEWQTRIRHEPWIAQYERHPVVQSALPQDREHILPIAIYMDATEYTTRDTLLVLTVHVLPSKRRLLCFAVRKSDFCTCGCGGWCTLFPLYQFLAWSLAALASGIAPHQRHDGEKWLQPSDDTRSAQAGEPLGFKAVVVDVAGDWAEFALRWGFPTWSAHHPCFFCNTTLSDLREHGCIGDLRSNEDYHNACTACEVWVTIETEDMRRKIRFALVDTKAKKGRALASAIPELRLRRGDRLEPCHSLPDVHMIDTAKLPVLALFWRAGQHPTTHHRHPVLNETLGIGIDTFSIDVLHTLHLGVFQFWIGRVLWVFFEADVFRTQHTGMEDCIKATLAEFCARLKDWYPRYKRKLGESAGRAVTQVRTIKPSMVGTEESQTVKLKAAETRHLLPFTLLLVREHRQAVSEHVNVNALIGSGEALLEYTMILAREPRRVSDSAQRDLIRHCHKHIHLAMDAGILLRPKHHLFRHLSSRIQDLGNPRMYSTYFDESVNRALAEIAASCHRMTFERRLFAKFGFLQELAETQDAAAWW